MPGHAASPGVALPAAYSDAMPAAARFTGESRLTWWGFEVYNARLWVAPDFTQKQFERHAFTLELTYLRNFRADDITRTTLEQMRRTGDIPGDTAARWSSQLRFLLRDVKPGDRIAGVNRPGRGMSMYVNDKLTGDITDTQFTQRFFAIWLAPTTSEPTLRAALLGDTPP